MIAKDGVVNLFFVYFSLTFSSSLVYSPGQSYRQLQFDDYRDPSETGSGSYCAVTDVLDASLGWNRITGAKRQYTIEKLALDIYNESLNHVSCMMKALQNAQKSWKRQN